MFRKQLLFCGWAGSLQLLDEEFGFWLSVAKDGNKVKEMGLGQRSIWT